MMTKKCEMAEWILDFFRKAKADAGQIVMMRNVQNKLIELNPRERDLFVSVANELIENGYFTYEETTPQCLRLTQKGSDYIYNPDAELDCCYDTNNLTTTQAKYIEEWHDSFVNYIGGLISLIVAMENHHSATDEDKKGFDQIKMVLHGREALEIEHSLAEADVKQDVLDKIEKLNKDLVDMAIEHLSTDAVVKEFLKKLSYYQIEQNKRLAEVKLKDLQILK